MCMAIYVLVVSVLIVTCLVAWPSVIATVPLLILNFWYLEFMSSVTIDGSVLFIQTNGAKLAAPILTLPTHSGLDLQSYYLPTSRELTRLESTTSAPVIHHFSETVHRSGELKLDHELPQPRCQPVVRFSDRIDRKLFSLRHRIADGHAAEQIHKSK